MFVSWLAELLSSLTPSERTHDEFAERKDDGRRKDPGMDRQHTDDRRQHGDRPHEPRRRTT